MNTVHIHASRSYDVLIGSGLLSRLGQFVHDLLAARKVCLVSDHHVWALYGNTAKESLSAQGFDVTSFVFPAGEGSKNGSTYLELLNYLAEAKLTRTDCLVALGGGVVGDLTGFAAATYLRGIPYIQIPTTLLARVDSSVGGKTAIDLPAGKNLAGAFYQPSLVLCDIQTLDTLHPEIFRDGCAEVIKYGILYDPQLFAHLEEAGTAFHRDTVIRRCVELKRDVVAQDEFDRGQRMKLNLGHTLGHGVEKASHYQVSHGTAVAIGMAIVARAALSLNLCDEPTMERIISVLEKFDLPIHTEYTVEQLLAAALSDKKRSGGSVSLIVPRTIGQCDILPTPVENLGSFIQAGL